MANPVCPEWLWLVVVGSFAAFAYGWATGSNDVANAFGTSVGAKTLKLWHAVIIAACFNFAGALVLGRVSTSVIAAGIAKIEYFYPEPEVYAYGMVCAMTISALWNGLASYWEMNVSATHSIIGSIIGFSLVYGGGDAVNWAIPDTTAFPPYRGVVPIVLAWFFSPVLTGAAAALLFFIVRFLVLRRKNSFYLAFWVLPFAVMLNTWICIYFVFTRGAKKQFQQDGEQWDDNKAAWVSACVAAGMGFLTVVVGLPLLRWKAEKAMAAREAEEANPPAEKVSAPEIPDEPPVGVSGHIRSMSKKTWKVLTYGLTVDIHANIADDPIVAAIHERAEVFDPKAEYAFSYLQVFSAICVIFAHGAGEVGYMAGPLTTAWEVYMNGILKSKVEAPIWCILIGAIGLVIGLATYGYNVTRAMGVRMAKLSPSRGFAAELATALVIMIAAQYGLPTSSSQCVTGGIVGVGLLEGISKGVNWKFFGQNFFMWIFTILVVGFGTGALFAQGVYAPSITIGNQLVIYEGGVVNTTRGIWNDVNVTLFRYMNASRAGNLTNLNWTRWQALNRSVTAEILQANRWRNPRTTGTIKPVDAMSFLFRGLSFLNQTTIQTLGQEQLQQGAMLCMDPARFNPQNPTYNQRCGGWAVFNRVELPFNVSARFRMP